MSENLIKKDVFYFHPKLQRIPPPPIKRTDENGNIVKEKDSPFSLKIRNRVTFEDIVGWFYELNEKIVPNPKRDIAALNLIYKRDCFGKIEREKDPKMNALDLLLFTIEAATDLSKEKCMPMTTAIEISNYIEDGLELYRSKRFFSSEGGIDYVC